MADNILTAWRTALQTLLADDDDGLGIPMLAGERDGISTERDIGCVFTPGFAEWPADVNFAQPTMLVRVWKRRSQEPTQNLPADPSPLEQLAVDLATILQEVQTTLLDDVEGYGPGVFYFRLTSVRTDHADQGVEASLLGWVRNPATVA